MIELRPIAVLGEAPLLLTARPRMGIDASVRPLIRGAVLAAILSAVLALPELRSLAADRSPAFERLEALISGAAAPRKDARRVALVREATR